MNGTLTRPEGPAAAVRGGGASYLARLLDVLETIGEHDGITVTDLAREAAVPLSTASRLTALLVERRFVERAPASGLLLPGPHLERIGLRAVRRLRELDRFDEAVTRLASTTGESVSVGLVIMNEIVLVARKESDHPLRMVVRVGDAVTPLRSAMGKAILSRLAPIEGATSLRARAAGTSTPPSRRSPLSWTRHPPSAMPSTRRSTRSGSVASPRRSWTRRAGRPARSRSQGRPLDSRWSCGIVRSHSSPRRPERFRGISAMATDITSSRFTDRARRLVPPGVHSNSRIGGGPTYLARGQGAYLWDIPGRRHLDCTMGNLLHPAVSAAHGDEEIAPILDAADEAFASIAGADAPPERTP